MSATSTPGNGVGRRALLSATGALSLGAAATAVTPAFAASTKKPNHPTNGRGNAGRGAGNGALPGLGKDVLRFRGDGSFTIAQFNDVHATDRCDRRTVQLISKVIETEKPDLVVLAGDLIVSEADTAAKAKAAMNNVVATVEKSGTPWVVTFGNHDADAADKNGFGNREMLAFYRQYAHNLNVADDGDVLTGTGNTYLPINAGRGRKPAYGVWLVDSGRYAPAEIAGQDFSGYPDWDWVRADQVDWYFRLSQELERRRGFKVPSSMFLHIPLWEHRFMWFDSVDERTDAAHQRALAKHHLVGDRREDECPGPFNSGLFNALLGRGETVSVSCGHDHVNDYWGNYFGVQLGYAPGTGYDGYGAGGVQDHLLRGSRIFKLALGSNGLGSLAKTYCVYARNLGIDVTPGLQPLDAPLPFPVGVR